MRIAVLDIGGTAIKSALWDGAALFDVQEHRTPSERDALMEAVTSLIGARGALDAIGVCTRGLVTKKGVIRFDNGPIAGYTGTDVAGILQRTFALPVSVENDVNAAAVGEGRLGAGKGLSDFLCVTYGTCVGGAIVIDGKLWRGASDSAGEFGAMQLFSESAPPGDPCGAYYENAASASALIKTASAVCPQIGDGKALCARLDQPELQPIVDRWIWRVSLGLSTLVHIFDPSCVILGGGILQDQVLFERIQRCTMGQLMQGFEAVCFRQAALGNHAGMIGAGLLAQELF